MPLGVVQAPVLVVSRVPRAPLSQGPRQRRELQRFLDLLRNTRVSVGQLMMNGDMLDESEVGEFVVAFPQWKKKTVERALNDKNHPNERESCVLRFEDAHLDAVGKALHCSVSFPVPRGVIIPDD